MQHQPFFPNPVFAWAFVGTLLALLAAVAAVDIRTTRIPKKITLGIAACGLAFNVARGAWMGSLGLNTWELGPGSAFLSAFDGLLFSVAGLLFAFTVFFGIFLLGSCGGGDVKLCAAIGAWIGAVYTIFLLLATVVALAAWFAAKILTGGRKWIKDAQKLRQAQRARSGSPRKASDLPRGRMTFSLPAAVAAAAVMLWFFKVDLQLAPAPQAPADEGKHASAAPPTP